MICFYIPMVFAKSLLLVILFTSVLNVIFSAVLHSETNQTYSSTLFIAQYLSASTALVTSVLFGVICWKAMSVGTPLNPVQVYIWLNGLFYLVSSMITIFATATKLYVASLSMNIVSLILATLFLLTSLLV